MYNFDFNENSGTVIGMTNDDIYDTIVKDLTDHDWNVRMCIEHHVKLMSNTWVIMFTQDDAAYNRYELDNRGLWIYSRKFITNPNKHKVTGVGIVLTPPRFNTVLTIVEDAVKLTIEEFSYGKISYLEVENENKSIDRKCKVY